MKILIILSILSGRETWCFLFYSQLLDPVSNFRVYTLSIRASTEVVVMSCYSIGQVSRETGVSVETIRYYEREGLLKEPERKENGYRQYNSDVMERLLFIQQSKALGFSLREIGELLSIKSDENMVCEDVKNLAKAKLENIEAKIAVLQRMKKSLKNLINICPGQAPVTDCPILDAIEKVQK